MKSFTTRAVVALAIGIALALSGCTPAPSKSATPGSVADAPVPAGKAAAGTVAKADDARTSAWVEYVRNRGTTLASKTDESLISTARQACSTLSDGALFEEVVYELTSKQLPQAQEKDQILVLGTGIVQFCPEYQPKSTGDDTADFLTKIRAAAPTIAKNPDSAILSQARMECPSVKEGPAGGAKVVAAAREAWGNNDGYRFVFLSAAQFCSGALANIAVNK